MSILAAFLFALLITLILSSGYKSRGLSIAVLVVFFFVLFMAGIAAWFWIVPFGPVLWGVYWTPILFIILLFTFLLLVPSPYERDLVSTTVKTEAEEPE